MPVRHHAARRGAPLVALLLAAPLASAPLAAQAAPGSSAARTTAADTAPTLRWRLAARRLAMRAADRQREARRAAGSDSAALRALPPAINPARVNLLVAASQYQAIDSAGADAARPSSRVALAAASATTLGRFFPDAAAEIAREFARDSAAERAAGVSADRIAAGARLGRAVADAVAEYAKGDGSDARWTSTVPTGPGMWWAARGSEPGGAATALRRPWVLTSADQFRPPPPPAFDSPEFRAAVDEVRRVARDRTAEQTRIARRWAEGGPAWWVDHTTDLLLRHRVPDDQVLRMLTVMAVGGYDLQAACWEAKYHYWTLRPTHADSTITIAEGMSLPNFPAYPSGHACFAGFASAVISHFVPEARDEVTRMAEENALSRLYAGVHYRFDNDTGLELGRTVARYFIAQEEKGALRGRWRRR